MFWSHRQSLQARGHYRRTSCDFLLCLCVLNLPGRSSWLREDDVFVWREYWPGWTMEAFCGSGLCSAASRRCASHISTRFPRWEHRRLRVQITQTVSGLPCTPAVWKSAPLPRQQGEWLFQKEHLVIFFNPLQLEIRSTVIKLQFLWLPTFAPAAVSEALAAHIHSQGSPTPPVLGGSVLLLHPQYQACKCALPSSLWRSRPVAIFLCFLYRIKHFAYM